MAFKTVLNRVGAVFSASSAPCFQRHPGAPAQTHQGPGAGEVRPGGTGSSRGRCPGAPLTTPARQPCCPQTGRDALCRLPGPSPALGCATPRWWLSDGVLHGPDCWGCSSEGEAGERPGPQGTAGRSRCRAAQSDAATARARTQPSGRREPGAPTSPRVRLHWEARGLPAPGAPRREEKQGHQAAGAGQRHTRLWGESREMRDWDPGGGRGKHRAERPKKGDEGPRARDTRTRRALGAGQTVRTLPAGTCGRARDSGAECAEPHHPRPRPRPCQAPATHRHDPQGHREQGHALGPQARGQLSVGPDQGGR